jgi:hypothetical protein
VKTPIVLADLTDQQLKNIIENYRRNGRLSDSVYVEALAEQAHRIGKGLDFNKSYNAILRSAAEDRFISYKDLADISGAEWTKVHYSMNQHLWSLVEYAHRKGWPMLSAVVVNKPNVASGNMEPESLKGFIAAAKELGLTITDEKAFLRDQQRRVFEWAKQAIETTKE